MSGYYFRGVDEALILVENNLGPLVAPQFSEHLGMVGRLAYWCVSNALLRDKSDLDFPCVSLSLAKPFAPLVLAGKSVTPLDRFFCRQAGLPDGPASVAMIWGEDNDGRRKMLQRWRLGRIEDDGTDMPRKFIFEEDYKHSKKRDEALEEQFLAVKFAQGLWRYLHEHRVPEPPRLQLPQAHS